MKQKTIIDQRDFNKKLSYYNNNKKYHNQSYIIHISYHAHTKQLHILKVKVHTTATSYS